MIGGSNIGRLEKKAKTECDLALGFHTETIEAGSSAASILRDAEKVDVKTQNSNLVPFELEQVYILFAARVPLG